jgi:hypothetical protein
MDLNTMVACIFNDSAYQEAMGNASWDGEKKQLHLAAMQRTANIMMFGIESNAIDTESPIGEAVTFIPLNGELATPTTPTTGDWVIRDSETNAVVARLPAKELGEIGKPIDAVLLAAVQ